VSSGDDERERPSWREIDRRRDGVGASDARRPRSEAARARESRATRQYVKQIDGLFSKRTVGARGEALACEVRDAHGTDRLAAACRSYRESLGYPDEAALLGLFLDAVDAELVVGSLAHLCDLLDGNRLRVKPGMRSQLRTLALDSDDDVAEAAEQALARL
jgi:hypothetical protein